MDNNQNNFPPHLQRFLSKLQKVKYIGSGRHMAICPAHDDGQASLSISQGDDGRVLLKCFAGCAAQDVMEALGLEMKDLFPPKEEGVSSPSPPKRRATVQPSCQVSENTKNELVAVPEGLHTTGSQGCTLQQYATLKGLPISFLRELGLSDVKYIGKAAVRTPYFNAKQEEISVQYRIAPDGNNKFRWRKGSKPCLYGTNRDYKSNGKVIIAEGPSDAQTLWNAGFSALGLPSADGWKEERDATLLDGITSIFVVIEPDQGGVAVQKWLATSRIRHRVRLLSFDGYKDPSALYLHDRENFKTNMQKAMAKAIPWTEVEARQNKEERDKAWAMCKSLAEDPDILSLFVEKIKGMGVAGQEKEVQILYLMLTSRHQKRPVSGVVKGQSAGGKSYIVEKVKKFFPASSYIELTGMSEHSLAYGEESLSNRFLIIFEIMGISNDIANYLLRSLLSEGRVLYETVEPDSTGKLRVRRIERQGPTGTIITTTQIQIHPENETRLLSINISDSQKQTKDIMVALSAEEEEPDLSAWQALQTWIDFEEHKVVIPYAENLARLIPPVAVRLRRDFTQVLNLIRSHSILHQANRGRDSKGRIIAEVRDYAIVRELTSEIISEAIGSTVSSRIREVVAAVNTIITGTDLEPGKPSATVQAIATSLKKDKSTVWRQVMAARKRDYLVNNEKVKGKPAQIVLGDPLPDDLVILPNPEMLNGCTVAVVSEGGGRDDLATTKNGRYEVMNDGQLTY
ncbi:MAG: hypothetical protein KG012_09370 [Deltaproteobacteria bacterium]|nr:hypothetical protein [Deltaproteobacteria bacterium]